MSIHATIRPTVSLQIHTDEQKETQFAATKVIHLIINPFISGQQNSLSK